MRVLSGGRIKEKHPYLRNESDDCGNGKLSQKNTGEGYRRGHEDIAVMAEIFHTP